MHARAGWQRCWWRAGIWSGAALVLVVAACSQGREGRAAQPAARERPLAPIDWKQVDAALGKAGSPQPDRSEEHTSELQSPCNLVCRLLLEKKKQIKHHIHH